MQFPQLEYAPERPYRSTEEFKAFLVRHKLTAEQFREFITQQQAQHPLNVYELDHVRNAYMSYVGDQGREALHMTYPGYRLWKSITALWPKASPLLPQPASSPSPSGEAQPLLPRTQEGPPKPRKGRETGRQRQERLFYETQTQCQYQT